MEGGGKGCIHKRAMGRKGMERAEDTTDEWWVWRQRKSRLC
jgi:hypothetical protein